MFEHDNLAQTRDIQILALILGIPSKHQLLLNHLCLVGTTLVTVETPIQPEISH